MGESRRKANYTRVSARPPSARFERGQEVYVYDTVRTPRGKGKKDGRLHGMSPVQLLQERAGGPAGAQSARYQPCGRRGARLRDARGRAGCRHRAHRRAVCRLGSECSRRYSEPFLCLGSRVRELGGHEGDVGRGTAGGRRRRGEHVACGHGLATVVPGTPIRW